MSDALDVRGSQHVRAPIEAVWDVISHVDRAPLWSSAIDEVTLPPGHFGVGSHFTERASLMGKSIRTGKHVTHFEAPTLYAEITDAGLFEHSIRIDLEPSGDAATRVTLTISGRTPRPFRLVRRLLERTLRKQITTDLRALASLVESGAR